MAAGQRVALVTAEGSVAVGVLSASGKGEALAAELGGVGVTGSNPSTDALQRLVALLMKAQGGGAIVNISSAWAFEPSDMFPTSAVFRTG